MTEERWQEIKGQILDTFTIIQQLKEPLAPPQRGEREVLEFNGPQGHLKLERIKRPVVLGKKTIGSKRIGGYTAVEYQYSETEFSNEVAVWRWDESSQAWQEIKVQSFFAG